MALRLGKLEAFNYKSWRHLIYDFRGKKTVLIIGKTGSGKSSIGNALRWCLGADDGVGADEIISDFAGKDASVSQEVWDGDICYKITRYRKHSRWKNKVIIHKNDKRYGDKDSKVSVINRAINNIIGSHTVETMFFVQRDMNRFPMLTDSKQKEMIESLTELSILPKSEELVKKKLKKVLSMLDIVKERVSQQRHSLEELENIESKDEERVTDEEKIKAFISRAELKFDSYSTEAATLAAELEDLEKKESKAKLESTTIDAEIATYDKEIHKLEKRLKKVEESKVGDTCRWCGSLLTDVSRGVAVEKIQQEILQYAGLKTTADEVLKNIHESSKQLHMITNIRENQRKALKRARKLHEFIIEQKGLLKGKKSVDTKIDDRVITKKTAQLVKSVRYKKSLKQMKHRLKFWKKGFGKKGIRTMLLPQMLIELTTRTNKYLNVFADDRLHAIYTLMDGRISQVYQIRGTLECHHSYAALSGGEKQMVDISTGLALREIAEISREKSFDNLILDEPLEGLDVELSTKVPALLELIGKKHIILISHTEALQPYFKDIVKVRIKKGISSFG